MKRGQVFVRALCRFKEKKEETVQFWDKWVSADVFDLDQESFNAFVIQRMMRFEMVTSIKEEALPENEEMILRVKETQELKYQREYESEK